MDIELIKTIAACVGCTLSCITLVSLIVKPIRQRIVDAITSKAEKEKEEQMLEAMDKKLQQSLENDENIMERLDIVEGRVLMNEAQRLKSELFNCGNRCRRGIRLFPEEFEHMRNIYRKYSEELKQNHDGTQEWEYIYNFYNNQKQD